VSLVAPVVGREVLGSHAGTWNGIGCERSRHLPPPNLEQRTPHCSPHEGADRREDKPRGQSFVLPYRPPGQGTRKDKHQEGQDLVASHAAKRQTAEAAEGFASFVEKRDPAWYPPR